MANMRYIFHAVVIMSNRQNLLLKSVFYVSRKRIFLFRIHQQFVHSLPQKAISQEIMSDVKRVEKVWQRAKYKNAFKNHLFCRFAKNSDLNYAVNMIHCACTLSSCSLELVFSMVKCFSDYIESEKVTFCPTLVQKIDILKPVLKYKDYQLLQLVCNVFKISEQSHNFKEFTKELIVQKNYAEAALLVSALHLQNEFDFEEILLPLLLQGKVQIALVYLASKPDLQLKAVPLLDSYLNITNTQAVSAINPRKIFKILYAVVNEFKISPVHYPNFHFIRSRSAIKHLIRKHADQSMSETVWEDRITDIIGENEDLKKVLIKKLVHMNDIKTAKKMAEKFNVVDSDLLTPEIDNNEAENVAHKKSGEDISELIQEYQVKHDSQSDHLKFALKTDDIKVVANTEDFLNCMKDITQNYSMIGIDCEWKPQFGLSRHRLSLIQLAVHNKVFVLDVLMLNDCLKVEHWDKLLDGIFCNNNIIKLGCGIKYDVNMILDSIKGTTEKTKLLKNFFPILDMGLFYQTLQDVYPEIMNSEDDNSHTKSLSSLCDIILGKPLNKEERLCDWEKRPLKESQIEYAALDAHCLIQMYDKLKEDSIKKKINFEHQVKVAVFRTTNQRKSKPKFKRVKSGNEFHMHSQISISKLKVVMDSVFERLGRQLRRFGADVVILDSNDSPDTAVQISESEGRIIICSEKLWNQVKHRVKEEFCYHLPEIDNEVSLKVSHLIQQFNVRITEKDIFSRCTACNSDDGMKLSTEDLKKIHSLQSTSECTIINSVIKDNLASFSSELQRILNSIFDSNINISFPSPSYLSSNKEHAFLCKKCGCIS